MMNRGTKVVFLLVCLLFMASSIPTHYAHAAGLYVRDGVSSPIREAPYENSRVTGMAQTNDYLEIFESRNDWLRIKTPKGEEGWVQSRYLTKQMPKTLVTQQLNEKIRLLTDENTTLQEENTRLQKENREYSYRMSGASREVEGAKKQYDVLKQESSQYLDLKTRYDTLQAQFKAVSEKMDQLTRENNRMKTSERLIFTLIGGGFIVIGLVIGTLLSFVRTKPKKGGYKF